MSMATGATGAALPASKGSQSVLVVEDDPGLATQLVRACPGAATRWITS